MKIYSFLVLLVFALGTSKAWAQTGTAAREAAEYLLKHFADDAAGETVQTMTRKVAQISALHGEDGISVMRKVGPRAFGVIEKSGDRSSDLVALLAKHGDDVFWVVDKPDGMALFMKYGDSGVAAAMKHKGIATPFIEKTGESGVKALNAVGASQGRHLVNLIEDGVIVPGQKSADLLDVVGRYGDKAADFIWRNKGALVVGTSLTAFLSDPEPFIEGAMSLPNMAVEQIAPQVNWTLVIIVGIIVLGVYLWLSGRSKRRSRSAGT